ncbi:hypothetical protein TI04_13430 [Achromatium sp. WMS2]|nr:hypothetical protein TI04_13430 [Achromatium sp. WMS2]
MTKTSKIHHHSGNPPPSQQPTTIAAATPVTPSHAQSTMAATNHCHKNEKRPKQSTKPRSTRKNSDRSNNKNKTSYVWKNLLFSRQSLKQNKNAAIKLTCQKKQPHVAICSNQQQSN